MRRFCYTLLVLLALLLLSTLSSSSESAPDGGDTSDWDEFWDSDARAEDEAEPGSWIPILDPDLSPEPKTEDDAVYYSGMAKMIAAASSGGPGVMEEAASEIEAAATAGNPHAQSAFGFLYEMGMMRGRKREKALMYHYFAADGGNTQSKIALAYTYLRQEMHDRAVELYAELAEIAVNSFLISRGSPVIEPVRLHNGAEENKDALSRARVEEDEDSQILDSQAQKGNAAAMYKIGMLYYFGLRGLRRDRAKALSWLLKAVEKGEPKSMELLGKMYARGDGVQRNYTKALVWLTLASQQHSSAYNGMGYLYVKGYGVEKNYTKAKEYFEKAAADEEVSGHYNLGVMYLKGVGVKKDVKLATKYFIMASNGGLPKAYYQLAKMFHTGLGLKRNFPMATALYKLVAERGPWSSLSRWALDSYLKGDMGKAFLLYSRMAELGYEVAQSNAAWILDKYGKHSMCIGESGLCTAAERFQRAHSLWWQASEQGNEHTALMIGDAYYYGRGTERDYARAAEAYMHAKSQSSVRAMINLGYMYEHGLGLPFDLHLARRYYEQALEIDPTAKLPVTLVLMNKNCTRGIEEGINSTLLFQSQSQEKKSHSCSCF